LVLSNELLKDFDVFLILDASSAQNVCLLLVAEVFLEKYQERLLCLRLHIREKIALLRGVLALRQHEVVLEVGAHFLVIVIDQVEQDAVVVHAHLLGESFIVNYLLVINLT